MINAFSKLLYVEGTEMVRRETARHVSDHLIRLVHREVREVLYPARVVVSREVARRYASERYLRRARGE